MTKVVSIHLTVIQPLLLVTASELFSTKYSRLSHLFIHALERFFSFAFHTQANMVYKYAHNITNYFQKPTHIFIFVLSFALLVDCLTFFHSRTEFLLQWDRMLCISIRVNDVAHCMLVKHADIYARESQNIWEFRPKLEISFQSHKCLLF